jgi:hypothetical protein
LFNIIPQLNLLHRSPSYLGLRVVFMGMPRKRPFDASYVSVAERR